MCNRALLRGIAPVTRNGAGETTRTSDLLITNQLLYQLSYASTPAAPGGAEEGPDYIRAGRARNARRAAACAR